MEAHKNFRFKKHEVGLFTTKDSNPVLEKFEKGCCLIGLTLGKFSLIDLIKSTLERIGKANVYVATWSAGIKDVHQVKWMLDTELINDFKLLTDHSYVNRQKKYAASIEDLFGKENIRTSEMHAKFVILTNNDYKVVIVSSMNLNANQTCETFQLFESPEITDFYLDFIKHHFDYQPPGFEESSFKVNKCLLAFFNEKTEMAVNNKHWSEL